MSLSLVIPTLNAAPALEPCLQAARAGADDRLPLSQVVVADGGSRDETLAEACRLGAETVSGPSGRGAQLMTGAERATGDWLLFLHADTRLGAGWGATAAAFAGVVGAEIAAGYFRFRLDEARATHAPKARRLERVVAWRCRVFGLPYGDQGLLVSRAAYAAIGGFRALPLMEDVELVRRIGRRRMHLLDADAVTSADRYRRNGYLLRSSRNLLCLALYFAGLPPRLIRSLYA